jgi:3'-phosphoadenosine 5'-phosphosulfate sulfotransferase (PAPS reductase)/FAD synthetase
MLKNSKQNLVINLSGGKDSTALLLMAIERGLQIHSAVFFDTSWEFPQLYKHLDKLSHIVNVPIIRLTPKQSFSNQLVKFGWPGVRTRWCTNYKVRRIQEYEKEHNAISLIGIAADEKHRIKSQELKKSSALFPLIKWGVSEKDALAYCHKHGFDWGGLYNHFDRVSCFCCFLQKIPNLRLLRKHYPVLWNKMLKMDEVIPALNFGFKSKSVHHFEKRFAEEDRQLLLPLFQQCDIAL